MNNFPSNPAPMPFASTDTSGGAQSTATAVSDVRPYAHPAATSRGATDATLIDAIRATVGPYVPAPWRMPTEETAPNVEAQRAGNVPVEPTTHSTSLPWIDSFLDTTDASESIPTPAPVFFAVPAPVTSIFAAEAPAPIDAVDEAEAMFVEGSTEESEPVAPAASEPEVVAPTLMDAPSANADADAIDEWPMAEAGAMMEALAAEISADTPANVSAESDVESVDEDIATTASAAPLTQPMAAWTDDDIMDIMPIRPSDAPSSTNEHWAVQARREADGSAGTEAAAAVLEGLARRVRDGELVLPGYSAEMGDAATLAAALAAILGVRGS